MTTTTTTVSTQQRVTTECSSCKALTPNPKLIRLTWQSKEFVRWIFCPVCYPIVGMYPVQTGTSEAESNCDFPWPKVAPKIVVQTSKCCSCKNHTAYPQLVRLTHRTTGECVRWVFCQDCVPHISEYPVLPGTLEAEQSAQDFPWTHCNTDQNSPNPGEQQQQRHPAELPTSSRKNNDRPDTPAPQTKRRATGKPVLCDDQQQQTQ